MLKYFAKSFAQKKYLSRTQKKTLAGSHVGTLAAFVMVNVYMDLQIDNHVHIVMLNPKFPEISLEESLP